MICPNCGKNTRSKKECEHCKKSTEFVTRSNIQPEAIPGMEKTDFYYDVKKPDKPNKRKEEKTKKIWGYAAALAAAAMLLVVVAWLIHFHLSMKYLQPEIETEPTVYQTEQIPAEELQEKYQVIFCRNLPQQTNTQEKLPAIRFGESIPALSDEEGYIFLGWNTDPVGEGTFFRPGDQFMVPLAEDLVLYGQWERDTTPPTEGNEPDLDIWEFLPGETDAVIIPDTEATEATEPTETEANTV